jgi:CubicO group peptidase (beta-lactamase class C family)
VTSPNSFIQAFIVAHKGKVEYERYPGMNPTDSHLWASTAKPIAGLLIEQLVDEGKIDLNNTYSNYDHDYERTINEVV